MTLVVARHLRVHGRVQGVFFRAETRRVAREHGAFGWVANRDDGSVEVWLEGEPVAVAAVESWIRAGGPPDAEVTRVDTTPAAVQEHATFTIRG